jgi:Spy/CpxP family protein refolding chaperone
MGFDGPPMARAFHEGRFGRWWDHPMMAQRLGITADQKQKMDSIYEQSKLKLIDLQANLEKQQVLLEPMIAAANPDQAKTLAQIDAVVDARAALEKENADMLFAIRMTLTPDQWQKLKTMRWEHRMGHGGPGAWRHGMHPQPGQGPGQPGAPAQGQPPQPPQ